MRKLTIAIDFDGTCVKNEFPYIGEDIGAVPVLKEITDAGHKLILFTVRSDNKHLKPNSSDPRIKNISGDFESDAVKWFEENNIPLYSKQKDPEQHLWTLSPKVFADIIIDDTALGIPLKTDSSGGKPYVDWGKVRDILKDKGVI